MERITRGHLEVKVRYLKELGYVVALDHHQPGGNTHTWAVESEDGSKRLGYSGRMTARECWLYLTGMIYIAELRTLPGHMSLTLAERNLLP